MLLIQKKTAEEENKKEKKSIQIQIDPNNLC